MSCKSMKARWQEAVDLINWTKKINYPDIYIPICIKKSSKLIDDD